MKLKDLITATVRAQIVEHLNPQNHNIVTMNQEIITESARSTIEQIVRTGVDKYKVMFLENGMDRYFIVDANGRYEAVRFQGTAKAEKMTFGSAAELKEFIDTQIDVNGFKQVTREGGVKRFLKAITRGFGNLLTIIGVSGIAVGVLYLLFWLFPVDVAGAAYQVGDAAKSIAGSASGAVSSATGAGGSLAADVAAAVKSATSAVTGEIGTAYQTVTGAASQASTAADLAQSASPDNVGAGVDAAVAGGRSVATVLGASAATTGIITGSMVGAGAIVAGAGGWLRIKAKKNKIDK